MSNQPVFACLLKTFIFYAYVLGYIFWKSQLKPFFSFDAFFLHIYSQYFIKINNIVALD